MPPVLALYGRNSDLGPALWIMLLLYAAAKLFEHVDSQVFAAFGIVSGHSLKHFFGASSAIPLIISLCLRRMPGLEVRYA